MSGLLFYDIEVFRFDSLIVLCDMQKLKLSSRGLLLRFQLMTSIEGRWIT